VPADLTPLQTKPLLSHLGADGQTPTGIVRWVYDHVQLQFYGGSAKTPATVLDERAGNDVDIDLLTIALLREAGIPARWGSGAVGLAPADWADLTGLSDGRQAARLLQAAGLTVTARTDTAGQIVQVAAPHTWVEAQVTPGQWTVVDPAWKRTARPGVDKPLPANFDLSRYLERGQGVSPLAYWEGKTGTPTPASGPQPAPDAAPVTDVDVPAAAGAPVSLAGGAIPGLFAPIISGGRAFSTAPADWEGYAQVSVGGLTARIPLTALAEQRLTLKFVAATDADKQILTAWTGLDAPPLFLVRFRPALLLDGHPVGTSGADAGLPVGERVQLTAVIHMGALQEEFVQSIPVGDTIGMTIQPQPVPLDVAQLRIQRASAAAWSTEEGVQGSILRELGLNYLQRVDLATAQLRAKSGLAVAPGPRAVLTAFAHQVTALGPAPVSQSFGAITVDAQRVANTVVSPSGNGQDERVLTLLLAAQASFEEGEVFRPFLGTAGESTTSLLQERTAGGIRLKYLCTCDPAQDPTALSATANARIVAGIANGYAAIAPSTPLCSQYSILQLVPLPVTEDEQGRREGIQVEPLLDQNDESIDGLAHVGTAAGQIDPIYVDIA
jgi:hypothetical protein